MRPVETKDITIHFDGKKCIHARKCVMGLPKIFVPGSKGGWIFPEHAETEVLARVIDSCPSGALSYKRHDNGQDEPQPEVNTARLWENGPIEVKGTLTLPNDTTATRALLCRCGQSKNKPFCDNSHIAAKFTATSEATTTSKAEDFTNQGGNVTIKPTKDGPLMVTGPMEVIAGSGRRIQTGEKQALCRCGASKTKPFCDGSHKAIGFEAEA